MKQAFRPKQEPSQNPGSRPSKHSIKVPEGLTLLRARPGRDSPIHMGEESQWVGIGFPAPEIEILISAL